MQYSGSGITTASWFGAWDGYKLTCISAANTWTAIGGGSIGKLNSVGDSNITGISGSKVSGAVASATRATNSTYTDWTETNTTTNTVYYIPFGAGYSTNTSNRGLLSNGDVQLQLRDGTTSAYGYAGIKLGNGTNQGTAGNKWGFVDMFPLTGNYYGRIRSSETLTANRTIYIPNNSGTVSLDNVSLWTGTLTAGNTASVDMSAYYGVKVYAFTWGAQHNFDIYFHAQPNAGIVDSSYPYQSGTVVPMYSGASATGTMEYHGVMCKVSSDKKTFYFCSAGYWTNGVSWTARQGNSQYYVYRIEGIKSIQ